MDVHHHTHGVRKKWSHYFWEFLMLFLAVFAGFLAENQREHIVEHKRAKVYAVNLYKELIEDTARLNDVISRNKLIAGQLDTFCLLVKENNSGNVTSGMLYYYGNTVTNVEFFSSNNTTVEQLKGSGYLRIMGNDLSYKISGYDKMIRALEKEYSISKTEFSKIEDLHFKVFDVYISETIFPETDDLGSGNTSKDSVFRLNNLPITNKPELMREYVGWIKFEANIYRYQNNRYLIPLKEAADELMVLLEKEFHVK